MHSEAESFAQEALAEVKLASESKLDSVRFLSLSQTIAQQATQLINMEGELHDLEDQYCRLSCSVSDFRQLQSLAMKHAGQGVEQTCGSLQRLPNELVLQSHQFVGQPLKMFPQLSHAARNLAESSPNCLGVLDMPFRYLAQPKPRYVGDVNIRGCCRFCSDLISL